MRDAPDAVGPFIIGDGFGHSCGGPAAKTTEFVVGIIDVSTVAKPFADEPATEIIRIVFGSGIGAGDFHELAVSRLKRDTFDEIRSQC